MAQNKNLSPFHTYKGLLERCITVLLDCRSACGLLGGSACMASCEVRSTLRKMEMKSHTAVCSSPLSRYHDSWEKSMRVRTLYGVLT